MTGARRFNMADAIAAGLFAALAVFMLVQPFLGRETRLSAGDPGPWLLPSLFGVGLLVLSGALMLRALRPASVSAETREPAERVIAVGEDDWLAESMAEDERRMLPRLLAVSVLCILYVLSFQHLGFYLATAPFLFLATMALSGRTARNAIIAAIIAILTTAVVGLVLTTFLEVSLPRGLLF